MFFIEKLDGGGAEKVLRNLVNSMDQSKFDITVHTLWKYDGQKLLAPGIRYRYCYNQPFSLEKTVKSRFFNMLFRAEAALNLVYPIHVKDDYDIEIAYLECGATKVIASSTNKKAKKLAWVHCELQKAISDIDKFVSNSLPRYRKFFNVVCVSEYVQQDFLNIFGEKIQTTVIYNTIDDAAVIAKSLSIPKELTKKKFTIVIVGRMYPQKNYSRLLAATKRLLHDDGYDFDLWILGDGEDRYNIATTVSEGNLQNNVILWGFRDNPYPFIAMADLLVCSSNYEGFSTFITEGLILGRPIVTTDCSGMRELLGDSEYGLITENDDDAFYEGMKRMLSDDALRAHYTAQAERRGRDFRRERLVQTTEDYFEQLVK
ncbi:MAG: glycosyltransferase [Clostridia bacterium]|nr:glycosyltransferase [Clostridia bacterium]